MAEAHTAQRPVALPQAVAAQPAARLSLKQCSSNPPHTSSLPPPLLLRPRSSSNSFLKEVQGCPFECFRRGAEKKQSPSPSQRVHVSVTSTSGEDERRERRDKTAAEWKGKLNKSLWGQSRRVYGRAGSPAGRRGTEEAGTEEKSLKHIGTEQVVPGREIAHS